MKEYVNNWAIFQNFQVTSNETTTADSPDDKDDEK